MWATKTVDLNGPLRSIRKNIVLPGPVPVLRTSVYYGKNGYVRSESEARLGRTETSGGHWRRDGQAGSLRLAS